MLIHSTNTYSAVHQARDSWKGTRGESHISQFQSPEIQRRPGKLMLSSEEKWGWSMSGEKHVSERSVLSALGVEEWGVNRAA